jgi:hypothetical protein
MAGSSSRSACGRHVCMLDEGNLLCVLAMMSKHTSS